MKEGELRGWGEARQSYLSAFRGMAVDFSESHNTFIHLNK